MVPMFTCGFDRSKVESSDLAPDTAEIAEGHRETPARRTVASNASQHFDRARTRERLAARRSTIMERVRKAEEDPAAAPQQDAARPSLCAVDR